jgi:hypothetical protein
MNSPTLVVTVALGIWAWMRHRTACRNLEHVAYGAVHHGQTCDCGKH